MAETISQSFVATFRTMVTHLAQQRTQRFAKAVTFHGDVTGDRDTFEQLGPSEMRNISSERFTQRVLTDMDHRRRSNWIQSFEWDAGIVRQDQLSLLIDPQRDYIKAAAMAINRQKDILTLAAVDGTAYGGKNGETAITFNTAEYTAGGQVYTVGGALTEQAMRILREIFDLREEMLEDMENGDMDAFTLAVSPQVHRQLLNEVQTTSRDFYEDPIFGRRPLVNGRIPFFMGFRIHVTNRLTLVSTVRQCKVWHRGAIGVSQWRDMEMDISQRKDLTGLPWQVVVNMSCNATRLQETGAFRVDVIEA